MSNEQDPHGTENEPRDPHELTSEELEQVVGGTDPGSASVLSVPLLPPTSQTTTTGQKMSIKFSPEYTRKQFRS